MTEVTFCVGGSGQPGEPQWMTDCIEHYWRTQKRGPSTGELLAWREGESSCRMEREELGRG